MKRHDVLLRDMVLPESMLKRQLKKEDVSWADFVFAWNFTGLDSSKHMQGNKGYCYGCFVETCMLIRYFRKGKA